MSRLLESLKSIKDNSSALLDMLSKNYDLTDNFVNEISRNLASLSMEVAKVIKIKPIPLSSCVHGGLYKVSARNFQLAVFNVRVGGFIGIREKFGNKYLSTEYHYEKDRHLGTVFPKERLSDEIYSREVKEGDFIDGKFTENTDLHKYLELQEQNYKIFDLD